MKGVIFAEMVGFLDRTGGPVFAEAVLEQANLPNGGAYSRIGNYPWQEAVKVIEVASRIGGAEFTELCHGFGAYLFDRFTVLYPDIIHAYGDATTLLEHVGNHIHQEVRVLYPDAQPPLVEARQENGTLVVEYRSARPMAHIASGLIDGAMTHFGDTRKLEWIAAADDGRSASFALTDG